MVKQLARGAMDILQEYSLFLILGVLSALVWANVDMDSYRALVDSQWGTSEILGHPVTLKFVFNDLFMVLFFGIATKEIVESFLPGGALRPFSKAVNPMLATLGGVLVPATMCSGLVYAFYSHQPDYAAVSKAWAIPTATDIALAWLVARALFGVKHPAVTYLVLLAVMDDAIGLGIIAAFYPDPTHPVHPSYLLLVAVGMLTCYIMRAMQIQNWVCYVAIGGLFSWIGLISASLHPALALVPIVPFMPWPSQDTGLFTSADEVDKHIAPPHTHHSTLHRFEQFWKTPVDIGLFFFGLCNAGVALAAVNELTVIVLASLVLGKTIGVTGFAMVGITLGYALPTGMTKKHLVVASMVAGVGLTVALFVTEQAFPSGSVYLGPAKMGALFSIAAGALAWVTAKTLGIKPINHT